MKIIIIMLSILVAGLSQISRLIFIPVYASVTSPNAPRPGVGTILEDTGVYEVTNLIDTGSFNIELYIPSNFNNIIN